MDNMTAADYMKVWKVRRKAYHLSYVLLSLIIYMHALIHLHSCSLKALYICNAGLREQIDPSAAGTGRQ